MLLYRSAVVILLPGGKLTFDGGFVVDDFARFMKILAFGGSAFAIVMSLDYSRPEEQVRISDR